MDRLNNTYGPQGTNSELESLVQMLRSRESAMLAVSEAKLARMAGTMVPPSTYGALVLDRQLAAQSQNMQNMTPSILSQTRVTSLFSHPTAWLEGNNTRNSLLSNFTAREAQLARDSPLAGLSRLFPARASMGLPSGIPLNPNKRASGSFSYPSAPTQSAYSESFAPIAKRQRHEEQLFENQHLQQLKQKSVQRLRDCMSSPPPRVTEASKARSISMSCDTDNLTSYQCLAREQIELFAAGEKEVEAGTKGRNRSIVKGQVGIRCRHCAHVPQRARAKGSTIYPSKLSGIYQASQNMANAHITQHCQEVPAEVKDNLKNLGNRKSSAGGGRDYWASGAKILGAVEDGHGLRFNNANQC